MIEQLALGLVPVSTWRCEDCHVTIRGDDRDAHYHHSKPGCWGHWLYEYVDGVRTGREIHTSDAGGYYLTPASDPLKVPATYASRADFANPVGMSENIGILPDGYFARSLRAVAVRVGAATPTRHHPRECDAALRAFDGYDRFHCEPLRFECSCGRVWWHVCDEAEGCFYSLQEGT